jgi:tRNA modification GTPase
MRDLMATHEQGRHIREGLDVVIVGRPNVGKSSVFNRLVGKEKAITSDTPGTTRDVVDGRITLGGVELRIHDTAGVKAAVGAIEKAAVCRTHQALGEADLALVVIDASSPIVTEDLEILAGVMAGPHLIVANKTDLPVRADLGMLDGAIEISALTGHGLPALRGALEESACLGLGALDCEVVVSERHASRLKACLGHLARAGRAVREGLPPEFAASDIRNGLDCLGAITGRRVADGVLDEIFSRFCIGK